MLYQGFYWLSVQERASISAIGLFDPDFDPEISNIYCRIPPFCASLWYVVNILMKNLMMTSMCSVLIRNIESQHSITQTFVCFLSLLIYELLFFSMFRPSNWTVRWWYFWKCIKEKSLVCEFIKKMDSRFMCVFGSNQLLVKF